MFQLDSRWFKTGSFDFLRRPCHLYHNYEFNLEMKLKSIRHGNVLRVIRGECVTMGDSNLDWAKDSNFTPGICTLQQRA